MPQTINYDTSQFKKIIRDYRADNAWTQDAAANFWGLERTLYSKYESGRARIPLEFALIICDYLGIVVHDYIKRLND